MELMIEKNTDGSIFFVPNKQGVAQTTQYDLSYRDASLSFTIFAAPETDFKAEPNDGPHVIQFIPLNIENKQVLWDFGDGTQSEEQSPIHSFELKEDEQTFNITMTVTEGPCRVVVEHPLKLSKQKETVFSIEPRVFCSRDKEPKSFTIEPPPKDINEIENPDGLHMDSGSAGITFVPAYQHIYKTTDYKLSYRGAAIALRIIDPNADFTINIQQPRRGGELVVVLKAKHTDADDYRWRITRVTGTTFDLVGKEAVIRYNQMNIGFGEQISIDLTLNYKAQTGVSCNDHKNYVITEKIFRNHYNTGEFDNNTSV
jgi:hypothetical protein